ncbi:hypothetical protein [Streptomyces sp. NBC_00162]|uniref:hypothetical protein n=1 Tax=Streptomyces sp. NBC_00162 TaxID=2903629 RepID=UPI00214B1D3C|nr:hypothetical protein [Streptomyces sp. NBC_00162]UUU41114.1 hypothetical protein JIW86_21245 [Streptomyces sp. NBC_00162]
MIQGFRPPRWLTCAALAAAALTSTAPAHARALAPAPGAAVPAAPAPGVDVPEGPREGLAGSAAGAGRPRPGRPVTEPANPEMLVASRPLPVRPYPRPEPPEPPPRVAPTPPSAVTALGTEPNERAADLAAHILPLGTGFALMGLGLGYMGMRLRKGL